MGHPVRVITPLIHQSYILLTHISTAVWVTVQSHSFLLYLNLLTFERYHLFHLLGPLITGLLVAYLIYRCISIFGINYWYSYHLFHS